MSDEVTSGEAPEVSEGVSDEMEADLEESLGEETESEDSEDSEGGEEVESSAETEEELKEEIEQAIEDGESEEQIRSRIKQFELKVNGKTYKREVDLDDDEQIQRILQREMAGQQAMQEAAEMKKLWQSELERLKSDPWKVLEELELDPDELAEKRIRDKVEQLKKSPEELEREQLRKEIEELRAKEKQRQEEQERLQQEQAYQQAAQELQNEMLEVLEADPDLNADPKTVSKIADAMLWAEQNGFRNVKVIDVLPAVKKEIEREFQEFFKDRPVDVIEKFIGKSNLEKLRKERVAAAKKMQQKKVQETAKPAKTENKKREKISAKDFFARLGEE